LSACRSVIFGRDIGRVFHSVQSSLGLKDKGKGSFPLSAGNADPTAAEFLDDAVVQNGPADHWADILGPEVGQVNESAGVGSRAHW